MEYKYDAFISYTHADCGKIAPEIQKGIENIAKPWWKIGRFRNVYRDVTNLSANPHLWNTITEALKLSDYLVLLASPTSKASVWVNREVEWWLHNKEKGKEKIILVLVKGEIIWAENDFNWKKTDCLPTKLKAAFEHEPLFVDLRNYNINEKISYKESGLKSSIVQIISGITGKAPREIDSEELKANRLTKIIRFLAFSVLAVLLISAIWFYLQAESQRKDALNQRDEANKQKQIAQKRLQDYDFKRLEEALRNAQVFIEAETRQRAKNELDIAQKILVDYDSVAIFNQKKNEFRTLQINFNKTK